MDNYSSKDISVKKITIKDSTSRLETYQNARFKIFPFMEKKWYLIVTRGKSILYNPDCVVFLDITDIEEEGV